MDIWKNKFNILACLLIAMLGFLAYSNSLGGKFVYDDEYLVKDNAYIKSPSRVLKVFTEDVGSGADRAYSFYRPVLMLTYAVDYSLWNVRPFGYHLTNTILHILAAICVFWFITVLFGNSLLSLFVASLFVVHPIHTEAVSYISGRSDPMGLIFSLLAFIFYIKDIRGEGRKFPWIASIFYILALLSRENSLILPVLILIYHFIFRERMRLKAFLPLVILAAAYIAVRLTFLKAILAKIVYHTTVLDRLPGAFIAIFNYLRLLILPFGLRMEYNYIKASFFDPRVIAGAIILVGAVVLAIRARKASKLIPFSILWFFISLFPVLNIYPINAYMAEHWLYLPSIGVFLLASSGLLYLYEKKAMKLQAIVILAALIAFYGYLTYKQNDYWNDPIYFYERTLKYSPNNFGFYTNLGREYGSRGDSEKALKAFEKAIEIEPRFAFPYNNIGNIYLDRGEFDKAIEYYKKAIEIDPNHAFTYNNVGNLYLRTGRYKEAIPFYKRATELVPNNAYVYNNLGKACLNAGMLDDAEMYLKKAIDIDPNVIYAYTNLVEVYIAKGNAPEAIRYFDAAVSRGATPEEPLRQAVDKLRK